MELIPAEAFLAWVAGVGIGFDPRYPNARSLGLLPPRDAARFWILPDDPASWPRFAGAVLRGLDNWSAGYLWPRSCHWPTTGDTSSEDEAVRDVVVRAAGIPDGWAGAVRFDQGEDGPLLAVLFIYLVFGWCVDDDLFFIPDHGRQIVRTSHHYVIHVGCPDEARAMELVGHMEAEGYPLPTEPPDDTFKWPYWMARPTP